MRRTRLLALPACLLFCGLLIAQDNTGSVIMDMDTVRHRVTEVTIKGKGKVPAGTVELVDGKFGKACKFTFIDNARSGFMNAAAKGTAEWDETEGFSFYLKGDGSKTVGAIEIIGPDFKRRYAYCFPLDSTEWKKVVVPWCDVIPELPAGELVDAGNGHKPSGFQYLWFGKWFYWQRYPANSFTIDHIDLEKKIDVDTTDYTPKGAPLARFIRKLKAKKPVTIVTIGHSLSDKRHWANRNILWSELLARKLEQKFGGKVTLVNPAIGGNQLTQGLIQMPKWLMHTPEPDLVTIWFGYNDWSSGMRGDAFKKRLLFAVDRVRRLTKGKADILLITTCPAFKRWDTMAELAEAVRAAAKQKKTGLADVADQFHKTDKETARKQNYWVRDNVHLGPRGHQITADTVMKTLTDGN